MSWMKRQDREELAALVEELNQREDVQGILVQLPLPGHIDEDKIIRAIHPSKERGWIPSAKAWGLCVSDSRALFPVHRSGLSSS